jgi:hypothetical protein
MEILTRAPATVKECRTTPWQPRNLSSRADRRSPGKPGADFPNAAPNDFLRPQVPAQALAI